MTDHDAIVRVFQLACLRLVAAKRKGEDGERFFELSTAIEDAFPEIIAEYRERIGVPR